MRIKETKVYTFSELNEDAKQQALENLADININHDWWEHIYFDAEKIGCEINGFDIDRGNDCNLEFQLTGFEIANKIVANHGEQCETYLTAKQFLFDHDNLVFQHSDGKNTKVVAEDNEIDFDNDLDQLEGEFKHSLSEDYRIMLSHEYDYLTSEEAIIETIEANEYEFDEHGNVE
jgi:uncharacterized protein YqkB